MHTESFRHFSQQLCHIRIVIIPITIWLVWWQSSIIDYSLGCVTTTLTLKGVLGSARACTHTHTLCSFNHLVVCNCLAFSISTCTHLLHMHAGECCLAIARTHARACFLCLVCYLVRSWVSSIFACTLAHANICVTARPACSWHKI